MPDLVQEVDGSPGIMEIRWTWLPFCLAMDTDLIRHLDATLSAEFQDGEINESKITQRAIEVCCEFRPHFKNLRQALEAIAEVEWSETCENNP